MLMSIQERGNAIARAKAALRHLEQHPATTLAQLGAARDQLNITQNWRESQPVWDAVYAIESIVLNVYDGIPETSI